MIDQVSFSSITTWLRCPKMWSYWYVDKLTLGMGASTALGLCFHRALARNFKQKITTGKDLPVSEVVEAFRQELSNIIERSSPRALSGTGANKNALALEGLLVDYMDMMAPSVQPTEVETPHYSEIAGVKFIIKPDLITEGNVVIDFKTTRKPSRHRHPEYDPLPQALAWCLDGEVTFQYHVAYTGRTGKNVNPGFRKPYLYMSQTYEARKRAGYWYKRAVEAVEGMKRGIYEPKYDCDRCPNMLVCAALTGKKKSREEEQEREAEAKRIERVWAPLLMEYAGERTAIEEKRTAAERKRAAELEEDRERPFTWWEKVEEAKYQELLEQQGYKV